MINIEYEATFPNINKNNIRNRLKKAKAKLIKKEFLQKRVVFNFPEYHEIKGGWIRIRDENDKVTMSLKIVNGTKIRDQKEICLEVNSLKQAEVFLTYLGCKKKAYQESKRELWILDGTEVTIDEWPFLEPFVEIEGKTEKAVKNASKKLGFDYSKALFCSVGTLYNNKYNISEEIINNKTPIIAFNRKNPFLKTKQ